MAGIMSELLHVPADRLLERGQDCADRGVGVRHEVARGLAAVAKTLIEGMHGEAMACVQSLDERGVERRHRRPTGRWLQLVEPDQALVVEQLVVERLTEKP